MTHLHPPSSDRRGSPTERLESVQLLRALAALLVVTGHSQTEVARAASSYGWHFARSQAMAWGAGVDLFFVVSGFIMVHASASLFGGAGAGRVFLARRIARVAPLYWACTTAYLAILAWAATRGGAALPSVAAIAGSYLFVPMHGDGGIFPVFDLGWTLNYEIAFYLLFAMLVRLRAEVALTALIALLVVLALASIVVVPAFATPYFWTRPIVVDFALGVMVGWARREQLGLPAPARIALLAAAGLFFACDPAGVFRVPSGATVANEWPRVLAAGVPAAGLLAAVTLGRAATLPRIARPLVALGDASYSLYLVHAFVLILLDKAIERSALLRTVPPSLIVAGAVTAAILAAFVCFRWIERPLSRITGRLLSRSPPRIAQKGNIDETLASASAPA